MIHILDSSSQICSKTINRWLRNKTVVPRNENLSSRVRQYHRMSTRIKCRQKWKKPQSIVRMMREKVWLLKRTIQIVKSIHCTVMHQSLRWKNHSTLYLVTPIAISALTRNGSTIVLFESYFPIVPKSSCLPHRVAPFDMRWKIYFEKNPWFFPATISFRCKLMRFVFNWDLQLSLIFSLLLCSQSISIVKFHLSSSPISDWNKMWPFLFTFPKAMSFTSKPRHTNYCFTPSNLFYHFLGSTLKTLKWFVLFVFLKL